MQALKWVYCTLTEQDSFEHHTVCSLPWLLPSPWLSLASRYTFYRLLRLLIGKEFNRNWIRWREEISSHQNQLPGRKGNCFYASSSTLPSVRYRLFTWLSSWLAHVRRVSDSLFVELGEGRGRKDRTESILGACLSIIIITFLRAIASDRLKRQSSFCWPWRRVSRILRITAVHNVVAWRSHWFGAGMSICGSAEWSGAYRCHHGLACHTMLILEGLWDLLRAS